MQAVILCAGEGERLKPLTEGIPKPLILINHKPILEYIFFSLPETIQKVILVIKKKNQKDFSDFLAAHNFNQVVEFVYQDENKKGTFYALEAAKDKLQEENKFLVLNGDDIFLKKDLIKILDSQTPTYGISYKKLDKRYRTCELNTASQIITSFRKQSENEEGKELPCFSGVLTLGKDFWGYEPVFYENGEAGIPHTLFANTQEVHYVILSEWLQVNNHEDVKIAEKYLANH